MTRTRTASNDKIDIDEASREVNKLRREIAHHDHLYYVKNAPEISDAEYDRLFARLVELEDRFPDLVTPSSPTQRVGAEPVSSLERVEHLGAMLSLQAVTEGEEVAEFVEEMRGEVETERSLLVAEPKFDGVSVEIVYEEGRYVRGSTRGDGQVGEDISHNLKTIHALPLRLSGSGELPDRLAVRGEVLMHKDAFQALNKTRIERGEEAYANPRNAAAGVIRRLDPREVARFKLDITVYDVLDADTLEAQTHWEVLKRLSEWGFRIDSHKIQSSSFDEIGDFHSRLADERDDLAFEIDGIVLKLNELAARDRLGVRARSPRWALAWKFAPREEITRIVDIALSVGRTGAVTPIALLEPVDIGGVTVSRATLHNAREVEKRDLRPGDTVRLRRAGDVIPEVVERIAQPGRERGPKFEMPKSCPVCGTTLEREGPIVYCPAGIACSAQLKGRLVHYASRNAMDIDGLGEKTAEQLVESGLVEDVADIYELTADEIEELEGFARKSAQALHEAIQDRDSVPLDRFLVALGIPHVGRDVARRVAQALRSLASVREATAARLREIDGIGAGTAEAVQEFFATPRNSHVIERILEHGVRVRTVEADGGGPLEGRTFVLTGSLDDYTRDEATHEIERRGGRVTGSVSSNTDYVVAGAEPGSKRDEAEDRGIRILDENALKRMLSDPSTSRTTNDGA